MKTVIFPFVKYLSFNVQFSSGMVLKLLQYTIFIPRCRDFDVFVCIFCVNGEPYKLNAWVSSVEVKWPHSHPWFLHVGCVTNVLCLQPLLPHYETGLIEHILSTSEAH